MCCISNLDDTRAWRSPAWLGVSPKQLEIDDGVWWCSLNKFFEDRCPFHLFHAGHCVHSVQDFLLVDSVVPAFFLGSSDLLKLETFVCYMAADLHRGS